MTQEEKQLLLIDLCARLPHGVRVKIFDESILSVGNNEKGTLDGKENMGDDCFVIKCSNDSWIISCEDFKPYLRPMSSMTAEEEYEYHQCKNIDGLEIYETHTEMLKATALCFSRATDWLNKNGFDYRGLIPMGLALEAPEGMYKF